MNYDMAYDMFGRAKLFFFFNRVDLYFIKKNIFSIKGQITCH